MRCGGEICAVMSHSLYAQPMAIGAGLIPIFEARPDYLQGAVAELGRQGGE